MAYIGVQPAEAYTSFAVQHFTTSATTSYTLDNPVANENEIALFINNVRQEPGSSYAYTASGTALTLSAATSASDTMYCVFIGKAVQTVTPANGSVTNSMLSGSIATSKLADGSTFATTNGITEADQFVITSNAQIASGISDLTSNIARETDDNFSQIGTGMSESSGIFTFPRTGIYYISALGAWLSNNGAAAFLTVRIQTTTNNSTYTTRAQAYTSTAGTNYYGNSFNQYIFNVNDIANRKVKFNIEVNGSCRLEASGTKLTFIRLGDAV